MFGPAGHRALLPHLLTSNDALVQAVDSYYESYYRALEWQWRSMKK